jgi:hypothetical protein
MPTAIGVSCLIGSYLPALVYIFLPMGPGATMHLDVLTSGTFIALLVLGLIGGIAASLALNGSAVSIAWILAMGSAFYAALTASTWDKFGLPTVLGVDLQAVVLAVTIFLYVIGIFFVAATGGREA